MFTWKMTDVKNNHEKIITGNYHDHVHNGVNGRDVDDDDNCDNHDDDNDHVTHNGDTTRI